MSALTQALRLRRGPDYVLSSKTRLISVKKQWNNEDNTGAGKSMEGMNGAREDSRDKGQCGQIMTKYGTVWVCVRGEKKKKTKAHFCLF